VSSGIYLIQPSGELVEMTDQAYDSEALLQELLEKYPRLLGGDAIGGGRSRRWLLVSREFGVPGDGGGAGRWSLDHLFLDQEGVPTLIEVKRSTDTRIRREVVGQMLDYAANGVAYWPVDNIRAIFDSRCQTAGLDPERELLDHLGGDADIEQFWQAVKMNLQAGRVRMIFVADEIPPELRRIVEFLNSQMDPAEVLAVEVKQYMGQQLRALVPSIVGQTAEAQRKKGSAAGPRSPASEHMQSYQTFFAELLRDLKAEMPTATNATRTQPASWYMFSLGRSYVSLYWGFTNDQRFRVDVYIDTPDEAKNLAIFDALAGQKDAIDHELGFATEWDRSTTTRVKRITAYYSKSISIQSPSAELLDLKAWAVSTSIRFVEAFRPRLRALAA